MIAGGRGLPSCGPFLLFRSGEESNYGRQQKGAASIARTEARAFLLLWNFFPMHMRGAAPTFTDTMHGLLAINPFVIVTIGLATVAFTNWFRFYSIATIMLVLVLATSAFHHASQFLEGSNLPTPWLGLTERIGQYSHQLWHAILALTLLYATARPAVSRRAGERYAAARSTV